MPDTHVLTRDIDIADLKKIAAAIQLAHGYDFHNYAMSSFKRRVIRILDLKKLSVETLLQKIASQPQFIDEFVGELTVNVTEMFRDPEFWIILRDQVIPRVYRQGHTLNIWHAGCSTGEEVYSMAILLHEMRIAGNIHLLATDLDSRVLNKARAGMFAMKNLALHEENYSALNTGNKLTAWFKEVKGNAVLDPRLFTNVNFQKHDLVTGTVPGQFDLILCRNVMIYFNQTLQNDVLSKFHQALVMGGYLAIGSKESLIWCDVASRFEVVNTDEKIYRKVRP